MPDALPPDATIHQRMVRILSELPAIGKTQRNEQQKFMYRGHDDVLNALNPLLAEHGVYVVPNVMDRATGERTTGKGSTMYEVNLLVAFTFYGLAGDNVQSSAWGEGTDMGDKSTNKAMTMAFKNVLAQAFAVSTAELSDSDGDTNEETKRSQRQTTRSEGTPPVTALLESAPQGKEEVQAMMQRLDPNLDWPDAILQATQHVYNVSSWREIEQAKQGEFWTRLANALGWISEASGSGDFPPAPAEKIQAGFAYAFDGMAVELRWAGEEETTDYVSATAPPIDETVQF